MYSFEEHCRQAKALLDSLNVKKVHIVGTSYGGETGMKFALMYPEFVASLSIIDSVSEVDEISRCFSFKLENSGGQRGRRKVFLGHGAEHLRRQIHCGKQTDAGKTRSRASLSERIITKEQKILYDTFCNDLDFTSELKNIVCPTLIICGRKRYFEASRDVFAHAQKHRKFGICRASGVRSRRDF